MFSELPKLFDRDFAIGFFLPGVALCAGAWLIFNQFFAIAPPDFEKLASTAIAAGIVWLVSVFLLANNYALLRLYEGYPAWLPLKQLKRIRQRQFRVDAAPRLQLQSQIDDALREGRQLPPIPIDFSTKLRLAVEQYPHEQEFVLPTRFGNIFRALEVYAIVVYGLDAVPAWPRLLAVLPDKMKEQLSQAKSMVDFFINLSAGGALLVILYIVLMIWSLRLPQPWLPILAGIVSIGSYRLSLSALGQYGQHVRSAFDLYRGDLAHQLGLELPRSAESERLMWGRMNGVMIFRSQYNWDRLAAFRRLPEREL